MLTRQFRLAACWSSAALFLALSSAVPASGGKSYKWVDENGITHYGSTPPPGVPATRLSAPPPPPTGVSPDGGSGSAKLFTTKPEAGAPGTAKPGDPAPAATQPTSPAANAEALCASARKNLADIQSRPRTRITEPDGKIRYLTAEEREDEIKKAEAAIQQYCK